MLYFRKLSLQSNSRPMDLATVFSLVRSSCKHTVVLSVVQEDLLEKLSKRETGAKLPELFSKFKETLSSIYASCEKYLEDFSEKLDKLKLEALSPSTWEEMKVNLDRLNNFVATTVLPGGSSDPLVQGFRPFVQFLSRFKAEKKSTNLLMCALQISIRLREILNKTPAKQHLPTLNEKLIRTQTEISETLGSLLASKSLEAVSKSKASDQEKLESLQVSFAVNSLNPAHSCLELASSLHPSTRKALLQAFATPIRDSLQKLSKKDAASEARTTELALAFHQHYLQLDGPFFDALPPPAS